MSRSESEKMYGSCEGPDSMYVKLISSDDHEFIIKREYAFVSGTLDAMFNGPAQIEENVTNDVKLKGVSSRVLQKMCQYLVYKIRNTNTSELIPEFTVEQEIAMETLMASDFLKC